MAYQDKFVQVAIWNPVGAGFEPARGAFIAAHPLPNP